MKEGVARGRTEIDQKDSAQRFLEDCASVTELCGPFLIPAEKKATDCFEQVCIAILQAFPPGSPPRPCPSVRSKGCSAFLTHSYGDPAENKKT